MYDTTIPSLFQLVSPNVRNVGERLYEQNIFFFSEGIWTHLSHGVFEQEVSCSLNYKGSTVTL